MSKKYSPNTLAAALVLTVATSAQSLLTTASKNANGKYDYNVATVPFLSELCKLTVSSILLYREYSQNPSGTNITTNWKSVMLFPIPSIIYLLHHSITFPLLRYVDPSTYQILGNLKIVTTGLASRMVLGRKLCRLKWLALLLLTVGTTTSQLGGKGGGTFSAPWQGYALGVANALLSAFAGVYTEYLMKKNEDTIHWQNIQLYAFGVLFNIIRLTCDDIRNDFHHGAWPIILFEGYTTITFLVVFNLAFSGLLVSFVMKYADTIAKVFSTSLAMMLTPFASWFLFNMVPSLPLFLGIVIACMSVHLYYATAKDLFEELDIAPSLPIIDPVAAAKEMAEEVVDIIEGREDQELIEKSKN